MSFRGNLIMFVFFGVLCFGNLALLVCSKAFDFFQLGVALGFVVPATVVSNQALEENLHLIGTDLFRMFVGVAIFTSVLLVVILLGKKPTTELKSRGLFNSFNSKSDRCPFPFVPGITN